MKVIIVRHGQTDENIGGGQAVRTSEVLLNAEGFEQAKKLGQHLRDYAITHAYSSPSARAVQTAQEILAHHVPVVLVEVEHLREQHLGIFERAPKNAWKEARAAMQEAWHLARPEKGESYHDVYERITTFFKDLFKKHGPEDNILLVSHGGPLGVLNLHLLEKELNEENYRAHQPKNTEFTIVEVANNKPTVHILNSKEHLA